MSTDTPRKDRLLREALGNDERRLPSVARTRWTIGLILAAIVAIALTGITVPERAQVTYTPPPYGDAISNPATAGWPAPRAGETKTGAQSDNVVDLTF